MYLRTTQRRNGDGSTVRYVQLAHNHRVGGVTQAEVLVNFGREDLLDVAGLRRLVASINRYLGEGPTDLAEGAGGGPLTVVESRSCGTVWLLDGLWKTLGIDTALGEVLDGRRFRSQVERVLFALVANRAAAPASKLAAADWASWDTAVPGLERMDADQAYRAMDLLIDADTGAHAKVQDETLLGPGPAKHERSGVGRVGQDVVHRRLPDRTPRSLVTHTSDRRATFAFKIH